mgnify:FL=1
MREGNYPNNSQYIYVDVNSDVDAGITNPVLLPFGFEGIVKYADVVDSSFARQASWVSGSNYEFRDAASISVDAGAAGVYSTGSIFILSGNAAVSGIAGAATASVDFPRPVTRVNATDGNLASDCSNRGVYSLC